MSNHKNSLRVKSINMSVMQIIMALSGGNAGSISILSHLVKREDAGPIFLLTIDSRHLYNHHIWEVYKDICGEDMERFLYHIQMELPCQICGQLAITGPYSTKLNSDDTRAHFEARQYGKPGSYWALKNPPESNQYVYPIYLEDDKQVIRVAFELCSTQALKK